MQKHEHINLSVKIVKIGARIELKINNDKILLITGFVIDIICKNTFLT